MRKGLQTITRMKEKRLQTIPRIEEKRVANTIKF